MQGLLSGPSLSPVQVMALHILDRMDRRKEWIGEFEALKRAILTARPKLFPVLYPELAGEERTEPQEPPESTVPPSPEEVQEMEEWLRQATGQGASISGDQLYGPDEGWE